MYFTPLLCIVVVVGFIPDEHSVTEGVDRFIDLRVELLSGELGIDVVVTVHILPDSAISKPLLPFFLLK